MGMIVAPTTGYNSYCSLAFAATYHADRGNTAWDDADDADQKAPALIKASDYIDANYQFNVDVIETIDSDDDPVSIFESLGGGDYVEVITPDSDDDSNDPKVVNPLVVRATALLAFYALTEDLFPIRDSREVLEEQNTGEGIGSIRTKYNPAHTDRFPAVSAILAPITTNSASGVYVGVKVR